MIFNTKIGSNKRWMKLKYRRYTSEALLVDSRLTSMRVEVMSSTSSSIPNFKFKRNLQKHNLKTIKQLIKF